MGGRPQPCGVGAGEGAAPCSCTPPPSVPCTVEGSRGCQYPPRLCGVRGAAAGDGAKPALGVGINRGGQGTCFGEPLSGGVGEPPLHSPRPHPRRGPSCPRPWTLGGIFPPPHGPPLRLWSPTRRAWTPPPMAPHTQHWWILLPGTTHLGHTRTGGRSPASGLETLHGMTPGRGAQGPAGSQFSNMHCGGWSGGHRIPSFTCWSFSPALASTKGWALCLADIPGLSHVHAALGFDLPETRSLGRRCQKSGLQRRGPRLRGAQGCSQALPVPPGLLLPKPVFSTGFVLLLPWELSNRECWVGWAGRPGQADGCAVSGQCQASPGRGSSTPHSAQPTLQARATSQPWELEGCSRLP